jgi:RNA polymerase sigma-70 factor (ECF subfamily)
MAENVDFLEFLRRIRAGDDTAAMELVRRFEPLIRREVRLRIGDDRLNRAFDSADVSQSVFASFFTRAAGGEFELSGPEQLARLLMTMARNRLVSRVRRERRQIRDVRRVQSESATLGSVPDTRATPSKIVGSKEELALLRTAMNEEEQQVFELRAEGLSWDEVAGRLGGTGPSRRMQFSRAVSRLEKLLSE